MARIFEVHGRRLERRNISIYHRVVSNQYYEVLDTDANRTLGRIARQRGGWLVFPIKGPRVRTSTHTEALEAIVEATYYV